MVLYPFVVQGYLSRNSDKSKILDIPTATLRIDAKPNPLDNFSYGCYYGWIHVDDSKIHKIIMSVENNSEIDFHIIDSVNDTYEGYDSYVTIILLGRSRGQFRFLNMNTRQQIRRADLEYATKILATPQCQLFKNRSFLLKVTNEDVHF
ncbi:Riboflavin kinase [Popillia japonica]|uniref:riboflavin kinase n=1 Tax=Popillia japonica TaxID=7064 RepID=A0AAW1IV43_POPJA